MLVEHEAFASMGRKREVVATKVICTYYQAFKYNVRMGFFFTHDLFDIFGCHLRYELDAEDPSEPRLLIFGYNRLSAGLKQRLEMLTNFFVNSDAPPYRKYAIMTRPLNRLN